MQYKAIKMFGTAILFAMTLAMPVSAQDNIAMTYLMDRLMIQDLMVSYATAHNTTEKDMYYEIFTEDVQLTTESGFVIMDGLDAVIESVIEDRERFNAGTEEGSFTYGNMRHVVTNMVVNIDGDTATGSCYLLNIAHNEEQQQPKIMGMGRYKDEYVKIDGRWWIKKRALITDWGSDEMAKIIGVGPHTPEKYR